MSAISTDTLDDIENHLRGQGGALAESLGQAFDGSWTLEPMPRTAWNSVAGGEELNEAGIVVALTVEDRTLLIAIPESLPLPTWIHAPDMSQRSRMDTLAMEWSLNALPESMACEVFSTVVVSSLTEALLEADPDAGAACLPFETRRGDAVARLWCVWPVRTVPAESPVAGDPVDAAATDAGVGLDGALPGDETDIDPAEEARRRLERLVQLPVKVVVRLAEKRIPLGQILTLSPGAIITFDKSCEDLLDLHVNNSLYARGEAVKIGEKFGLKINEVGSVQQRASAILQPQR
jgi:flagellar motor switch protein FliN/FliY